MLVSMASGSALGRALDAEPDASEGLDLSNIALIARPVDNPPASPTMDDTIKHLMCLGPAIDTPSPLPARTGDEVGYSAEHLVA
jgi:hypothetical protein